MHLTQSPKVQMAKERALKKTKVLVKTSNT